jgi:hypothetical protein
MAWIAVRKLRDDDVERIHKSAQKFAERHQIEIKDHQTAWSAVEEYVQAQEWCFYDGGYMRRLWEKCFSRAVGIKKATGVAWSAIGYYVKGGM